jgi:type II secretory pathway pseudopilin PulG
MGLHGQGSERGYAMAALLIALAIMAILMSVAMPVWRQEARREKEAELVFRGEQYARAIALYRFKNSNIPNAFPASIDVLVDGRYLRKKYKDPMTKDGQFEIIGVGSAQQPTNPTAPGAKPPIQPFQPPSSPNSPVVGGMMGVRSKSEENSLRSYRGQTRYNQWAFTFNLAPRPGGSLPLANSPDGRGNEGRGGFNNPGGRGGFPPPGGSRGGSRGLPPPGGGSGVGTPRGGRGPGNPSGPPPTFPRGNRGQ